jgi:hypothetical protein
MPALERIRELYADPRPSVPETRERARLALVMHMEPRPRRRLSRRALLPAAGLAATAAATVIALVGVGDESTIDARAAATLRDAAAKAKTERRLGRGPVLYVKSVNAYMTTWAEAGFSVLVPHVREIWLGPNGGLLRSSSGEPEFLSEHDRQRWIAAGRPRLREGGTGTARIEQQEPNDLPTDPDALFARLETAARGHSEGTYREMFTLVGDAFRETNITPAQRAALYEVAARIPGVELVGPVRDSIGRRGVAVAMEHPSDGTRETLVIDPETGTLLAEQDVTLEKNWYRYPAGTVVGHSTYLDTRMVSALGARPK